MSLDEQSFLHSTVPSLVWRPSAAECCDPARTDGGEPSFSIDLEVRTGTDGQVLVLRFTGEIDLVTLPAVRDALAAARNATSCDVVVDLAALEFCCARGFALLADAAEHAASAGTGFTIMGLGPRFHRITSLVWPGSAIAGHPGAAGAVAARGADRALRVRALP